MGDLKEAEADWVDEILLLLVLEKDTSSVSKIKDTAGCKSKETYLCGMNDWCLLFNFSLDTDDLSKNVLWEGL